MGDHLPKLENFEIFDKIKEIKERIVTDVATVYASFK